MQRRLLNIIIAILTAVATIATGGGAAAQEADSTQFDQLIRQCNELIATEPHSAVEYAAMAKQIAETSGDSVNIATAYATLGKCYYHRRVYYLAMDLLFKAFEINALLDRQEPLAECFVDIAQTYREQEVYDMAEEYCNKAITICDQYKYPNTKAYALTTLGRIYIHTSEDEAVPKLFKSKQIYDSLGLSDKSADINLYIAMAYSKLDESDSAIAILEKNLKEYGNSGNKRAIARTYFVFGHTYDGLGDREKAENYYKTALTKFNECNMPHDIILTRIRLGNLQYRNKAYEAAIENASKGLQEAQKEERDHGTEEIIGKHQAYEILYKSYQKIGNNDLALQYCERFAQTGDSVYTLKRQEQFSEFQVSMESQRLQKEIDMLQVNSEKEKLRIEKKQANRNITLLGIIIALVIAVVIIYYFRYKEKARHNADLSLSNSRMEQEIKERKIAETELRNSEEKYRLLFRKTPVGIVQFNDKHIITAVNERFIQIFGLKNKSIIGQDIYTVIPQKQFDIIEQNSDTGKDSISKSELKVNTSGGEVFASVSYKSYADQTGTSVEKGGILIIEDITERKVAEAQLAAYNAASDNIIEMMPESIFLLDSKANYIFAQIPGINITERNTYLGKNMREMLAPDVLLPFLVAFNTVKKTGEVQYAEYETESDDPTHPTIFNEAQFTRCDEDKVLVVVRDISRLKMAESKLRMAKRTAESGSKAKNEFILGISSELKEPIESILYNCEQLTPSVKGTEASEKLKLAINSALFVNETFTDILKLTEVEEGKPANIKEVNPLEVAKSVFDIFKSRAEDKKIGYKFEAKSGLPSSLVLDEIRLRQILFNIISNGIKYTEKGYVKLILSTTENALTQNTNLNFIVEDTGIGLSEEQIDNLFNDTNVKKGLVLTKKMIDAIGASIHIKSELGKGSSFIISIPNVLSIKQPDVDAEALHATEAKPVSNRRKNSDAMREYISVLKDKLMPQYHEMEQQISFEALESFVAQLREQSEHYKIEKGIELADELAIDIRNYDIPNITRNIRKIEAYIQNNIHDLQGE
ncbi:MAG: PAS domain S-box protein [Bacteroidales bacterium]|nr:PAS domain S-box protein [Bacteroidales bacterium]